MKPEFFILTATTGELWICAHSGLRQGRISVPCAHTITRDRQPPAGQQVSSQHRAQSFTRAISNSLRGVLLTDYFKAHQFSCYNHPSEKKKSNRRTKLGSVSNGKEQRTMQQESCFSVTLVSPFPLLCLSPSPLNYDTIPTKNSKTLRGNHYINAEPLCY